MKLFITSFLALVSFISASQVHEVTAVWEGLKTNKQKADTLFSFAMKNFYKQRFDSAAYFF